MSYKFNYFWRNVAYFTRTNSLLEKCFVFFKGIRPKLQFFDGIEYNDCFFEFDDFYYPKRTISEFAIFRKSFHLDVSIHSSSFHPYQHKLAEIITFGVSNELSFIPAHQTIQLNPQHVFQSSNNHLSEKDKTTN